MNSDSTAKISAHAKSQWLALLGPERALFEPEQLAAHHRSTGVDPRAPAGLLRPARREQVAECVKIAAAAAVALYPVSCGKNWGYGDALPVTSGQVVLDLSDLNRIIEVNEELAYAVIEPGVTQGQLSDYLRERGLGVWVDCTGSSPETSVVGNSLERGIGGSFHYDHFFRLCSLEVVLADGRTLRTGYDRFEQSALGASARWGVGPYLDGLFSQSGLGVVTEASIWLMRKPEAYEVFVASIDDGEKLPRLVDTLRELRFENSYQSGVAVISDLRTIAGRRTYPWAEAEGKTPLPAAVRARLRAEMGVGAWTAFGALYGSRAIVEAGKHDLRAKLSGWASVHTVDGDDTSSSLAQKIRPMLDVFAGKPTQASQHATRWRLRRERPGDSFDPVANRCGVYWIAPTCRQNGVDGQRLVALLERSCERFGFDPLLTLLFMGNRAMVVPVMLAFDMEVAEDRDAAQRCYLHTLRAVIDEGFIPYRVGTETMHLLRGSDVYDDVVQRIRSAIDPQGLMSPGRYEPAVASRR